MMSKTKKDFSAVNLLGSLWRWKIMLTTRLNITSDMQIQAAGIEALKNKLGVVGTLKFFEQYDNGGYGNYTEEKYQKEDTEMTKEEILNMFSYI
jgi:hypothetical protein